MRCIAHRGFAETNPENTLAAVREAANAGANLVEVDVRRCGSGELVLAHDAGLDRISDATGRVDARSLAELRSLDVLGTQAGLPTLRAAFETACDADVRLHVELKERDTGADVLAVADEFGADPLLSSFDPVALDDVADASIHADPETAYIFADSPADSLERARDLGCVAVHPQTELCTAGLVEQAHDDGLAVNAWTVRDEATATRLRAAGVDGLIADAPAYCRRESSDTDGRR
jgi:glycerophosphoryl diester phosphodiesterase